MTRTIKTRFLLVLCGMLFAGLTANCSDKKTAEKEAAANTAAKTESVINVSLPPFQKFVVVTVEESVLLKTKTVMTKELWNSNFHRLKKLVVLHQKVKHPNR